MEERAKVDIADLETYARICDCCHPPIRPAGSVDRRGNLCFSRISAGRKGTPKPRNVRRDVALSDRLVAARAPHRAQANGGRSFAPVAVSARPASLTYRYGGCVNPRRESCSYRHPLVRAGLYNPGIERRWLTRWGGRRRESSRSQNRRSQACLNFWITTSPTIHKTIHPY